MDARRSQWCGTLLLLLLSILFRQDFLSLFTGSPGACAANLANAREFIEQLPEGYDAAIGERGATLSGGQQQRIKAAIRETPILILDEASTSLDVASEKLVFKALDRLMEGRTSIVVTHRLQAIRSADVIFMVKDGQFLERGNHADLLRKVGLYAELHELQFREEKATSSQS